MTLRDLPWDFRDMKKPSLWQVQYVKQLKLETGVDHVDVELTRASYSDAIDSLVKLRRYVQRKQLNENAALFNKRNL